MPALIFVVPIHLGVLFALLGIMTVLSVVNHLGYELYPRGWDDARAQLALAQLRRLYDGKIDLSSLRG